MASSHTPLGAPQPPHPTLQPGHSHTTPVNYVQYMGMAPTARLAFIDLGDGTSDSIYTPADLAGGYFDYTYAVVSAWARPLGPLLDTPPLNYIAYIHRMPSLWFHACGGGRECWAVWGCWRRCKTPRCGLMPSHVVGSRLPSSCAWSRVAIGWRRHWLALPCISHTGPTSPLGCCPSSIAAPSA